MHTVIVNGKTDVHHEEHIRNTKHKKKIFQNDQTDGQLQEREKKDSLTKCDQGSAASHVCESR